MSVCLVYGAEELILLGYEASLLTVFPVVLGAGVRVNERRVAGIRESIDVPISRHQQSVTLRLLPLVGAWVVWPVTEAH